MPRTHPQATQLGFTLLELLVVVLVLGVLVMVTIPTLHTRCGTSSPTKQAQTNIMNIAGELERDHASGAFSYRADGTDAGCPGSSVYLGNGAQLGALPLAIQGDYYAYTVETWDADGDGRCECHRITAEGRERPATSRDAGPLTLDCHGTKTGPWR